jgi:hypothetical protein
MKKNTQVDVFLDNVCWEAEASPIKAHIEVAVAIEIIGAHEDMKITDAMDDDEENKEHRGARETSTVTADLEVLGGEDGGANLVEDSEPQAPECVEVGFDVEKEDARVVVVCLVTPILCA